MKKCPFSPPMRPAKNPDTITTLRLNKNNKKPRSEQAGCLGVRPLAEATPAVLGPFAAPRDASPALRSLRSRARPRRSTPDFGLLPLTPGRFRALLKLKALLEGRDDATGRGREPKGEAGSGAAGREARGNAGRRSLAVAEKPAPGAFPGSPDKQPILPISRALSAAPHRPQPIPASRPAPGAG